MDLSCPSMNVCCKLKKPRTCYLKCIWIVFIDSSSISSLSIINDYSIWFPRHSSSTSKAIGFKCCSFDEYTDFKYFGFYIPFALKI